jgi:hypothetical protein
MADLANYILDTQLPINASEEYSEQIKTLGKTLYDNRGSILQHDKDKISDRDNRDIDIYGH